MLSKKKDGKSMLFLFKITEHYGYPENIQHEQRQQRKECRSVEGFGGVERNVLEERGLVCVAFEGKISIITVHKSAYK